MGISQVGKATDFDSVMHRFEPRIPYQGSLGEWFKPAVLKTADQKWSVSSNLTASAILKHISSRLQRRPQREKYASIWKVG